MRVKLSEILTQSKTSEYIDHPENEKFVTVSGHGLGVKERKINEGKTPVQFNGYRIKEGQLIYSRIGASDGAFGIVPQSLNNAVVSKDFPVFDVDSEKAVIDYLVYFLTSDLFCSIASKESFGATMTRFKEDKLLNCEIELPAVTEQAKIVGILNDAKAIISLRKQELQKLDELVKARFVEMFGDRWKNDKGWNQTTLNECATFYNGKAHEQVIDEDGQYILVTSRCIASDMSDYRRTNAMLFPLQVGDICMVMSDVPNGKALAKCVSIEENDVYTLNQRICCFRDYKLNPVFFYYLLNRHEYLLSFDNGDSQTNLRKNDLLACPVICPPIELQDEFARFATQLDKSKVVAQKALDEAQLLFDSLMQKYFG